MREVGEELGVASRRDVWALRDMTFFPLPSIAEILVAFGLVSFPTVGEVAAWLEETLLPAGVSHAALAETVESLVYAREEASWRLDVSALLCECLQRYSRFIVFKNIDPAVKARFVASCGHYLEVLGRLKEEAESEQAGNLVPKRDATVRRIEETRKSLEEQKKREKSVLYGQMVLWSVCWSVVVACDVMITCKAILQYNAMQYCNTIQGNTTIHTHLTNRNNGYSHIPPTPNSNPFRCKP